MAAARSPSGDWPVVLAFSGSESSRSSSTSPVESRSSSRSSDISSASSCSNCWLPSHSVEFDCLCCWPILATSAPTESLFEAGVRAPCWPLRLPCSLLATSASIRCWRLCGGCCLSLAGRVGEWLCFARPFCGCLDDALEAPLSEVLLCPPRSKFKEDEADEWSSTSTSSSSSPPPPPTLSTDDSNARLFSAPTGSPFVDALFAWRAGADL